MTTPFKSNRLIAKLSLLMLLLSWSSPAVLHAAVARASVVAEVVEPAVIDAAQLLAAAGGAAAPESTKKPASDHSSQAQPQVRLNVVDGVPFLSIDYN